MNSPGSATSLKAPNSHPPPASSTRHEAQIRDERIVGIKTLWRNIPLFAARPLQSRTLLESIGGAWKTQTLARSRNEKWNSCAWRALRPWVCWRK